MQTESAIHNRSLQKMKYTVIKSKKQYLEYCNRIELLGDLKRRNKTEMEELELLQLLVDTYDEAHLKNIRISPNDLLKTLMAEHRIKGVEIAKLLQVSPGLVSDMLNGKKALSKSSIRILAERFGIRQEAFNRIGSELSPIKSAVSS